MMKILKLIGCSLSLLALPLAGQAQNGGELFRDMNAPCLLYTSPSPRD